MKIQQTLMNILFPSAYDKKFLARVPHAPALGQRNLFACFDYRSSRGKKVVYTIKRKRDRQLSRHLAEVLLHELAEFLGEQQQFSYFLHPLVIPIPIAKKGDRKYNQCADVARAFSRNIDARYSPDILVKKKVTQKQALLRTKYERQKNVRGCFAVNPKMHEHLGGADIIIVDDLITTGATMHEAIKELQKYQVGKIIGISIAH